jgi:hypothetical protein
MIFTNFLLKEISFFQDYLYLSLIKLRNICLLVSITESLFKKEYIHEFLTVEDIVPPA